jgi:O-methyltransferase involved in polyketide biosynthesis
MGTTLWGEGTGSLSLNNLAFSVVDANSKEGLPSNVYDLMISTGMLVYQTREENKAILRHCYKALKGVSSLYLMLPEKHYLDNYIISKKLFPKRYEIRCKENRGFLYSQEALKSNLQEVGFREVTTRLMER